MREREWERSDKERVRWREKEKRWSESDRDSERDIERERDLEAAGRLFQPLFVAQVTSDFFRISKIASYPFSVTRFRAREENLPFTKFCNSD